MISLLVVTDGRLEYLKETVESARENLHGPITERLMIDDSGDEEHRELLRSTYPDFFHLGSGPRKGFGGTIAAAWRYIRHSACDYVFHLEGDFTFNRPVDLEEMRTVLDINPNLVQLALRRQPWNPQEEAAGGIVELHPEAYTDREGWLEHRLFYTTNPSLYRKDLTLRGWPLQERSEGVFTHQLLTDPNLRFGFWGPRTDSPWVEHIGQTRAGVGY